MQNMIYLIWQRCFDDYERTRVRFGSLGRSINGWKIAQEYVLNFPKRVSTLTLIYTSSFLDDPQLTVSPKYFDN